MFPNPLPNYFDRYILMNEDVELLTALDISLKELESSPVEKWLAIGNGVYAPGKWTIKDILQHLTDTERVFSYRATAFSRGEQKVASFDEELYAKNAEANYRTLEDLLNEAIAVRKSTIYLFKSFSPEMLNRVGIGFKGEYSVQSIGYIIPGHQRWHFKIIEEKYVPLLESASIQM